MKKEYLIRCNFKNNELICNDVIKLVANDVNSCILKFNFEEELSNMKVLFKLKKQNSDFYWIKEVINNQVEIVDFDKENNPLIVISKPGIYEFELSVFDENSKLTNYAILKDIKVREELINQTDIDNYVSSSEKMPVLDQIINQNIAISNEEKIRETAESSRQSNEQIRKDNEVLRKNDEQQRTANENIRKANEETRKTNETIREENEISREKYINDLKQDVEDGKFDGKDYVITEQDKQDIVNEVINSSTSEFNKNAIVKTKEYNDNVTNKMNSFNDNYNDKKKIIDDTTVSSLSSIDSAKNSAINEINTKVSDELNTYNTNATSKVNDYNTNHTSKMKAYNKNATSKTETFNTNAEEKTTEFNNNVSSYDKRITENTNRIKRLETDIFDSGNASGSSINIQDSTLSEFSEFVVDGVGKQKTTQGKQLVDFGNYSMIVSATLSFENDALSISSTDVWGYAFWDITKHYKNNPDKTLCFNYDFLDLSKFNSTSNLISQFIVKYNDGTANRYFPLLHATNGKTPRLIPSDTSNVSEVLIYVYSNASSTVVDSETIIIKPMLYFGDLDNPSEYEKYTGNEPSPSPDYPQPIEVIENDFDVINCGKNLVSSFARRGNIMYLNGTTKYEDYIFKKGTYTLSHAGSSDVDIYYQTEKESKKLGTGLSISFTVNDNFNVWFYKNNMADEDVTDIQLERGSKQTALEPYEESRTTFKMPEGKFAGKISDTIKDQFRISYSENDGQYHLYLSKYISRKIVNQANITKINIDYQNVIYYAIPKNNDDMNYGNFNYHKILYSHGISTGYPYDSNEMINKISVTGATNTYWVGFSKETSLAEVLEKLNNSVLYYPLAEPYTLDLGIVNMPRTFSRVTNVFTDSPLQPNIEVSYYRDFKMTIQELQNKVTTLEETSVKNTDYAALNKAGIIKANSNFATNSDAAGNLIAGIRSLDGYGSLSDNAFISKGTLEAILRPIRTKLEELSSSAITESEVIE